jgi:hypothetical protein
MVRNQRTYKFGAWNETVSKRSCNVSSDARERIFNRGAQLTQSDEQEAISFVASSVLSKIVTPTTISLRCNLLSNAVIQVSA